MPGIKEKGNLMAKQYSTPIALRFVDFDLYVPAAGLYAFILLAVVVFASIGASAGQASAAGISAAPFSGRWVDVNLTSLRATR